MDDSMRPLKILAKRKNPILPVKYAWHQLGLVYRMSKLPLMPKLNPWIRADKNEARWLPVNKDLETDSGMPLPLELLDRFFDEASHRMLIDSCVCRTIEGCRNYPRDIGCVFMGDGAANGLLPAIGREITPEEAKAHARKAIDAGLVPMVGKIGLDATLAMQLDKHNLLTACFCCDCCCVTGHYKHIPVETLDPMIPKLEGVVMEVDGDCSGCGKCATKCYVDAIEVQSGKARISEMCRACGRCATVCPQNAISIKLTDPDFAEKAYKKIRAHVDHT
ncbi:MAG: 4Fe-4S binding protein [Actinobacteria bacterium]|nr:4Fe-4S binding protein [Actinomycetota bacterium]